MNFLAAYPYLQGHIQDVVTRKNSITGVLCLTCSCRIEHTV